MNWVLAFTEVSGFICSEQTLSVRMYKPLALSLRWPMLEDFIQRKCQQI